MQSSSRSGAFTSWRETLAINLAGKVLGKVDGALEAIAETKPDRMTPEIPGCVDPCHRLTAEPKNSSQASKICSRFAEIILLDHSTTG